MSEVKTKVINGISFQISQPFVAGQTINEAEAKALNQVRSENIGNNLRNAVKAAQEKAEAGDAGALQELNEVVAKYDAEYTFALGGGGSSTRKLDPYEREALKLAKEIVKSKLAAQGRKITDIPEGLSEEEFKAKLEAKYEEIAALDEVVKAAKKNVDAKKKQSDALLDAVSGL